MRHHLIIETDRVLLCLGVVELTALGLDHVGLAGLSSVAQVVLGVETIATEQLFVLPGRVLLLDQTHGRASVPPQVVVGLVFVHHVIEALHVTISSDLSCRTRGTYRIFNSDS